VNQKPDWKEMFMVLQIEETFFIAKSGLTDDNNFLYENICHLINQSLQVFAH
jgi:hypothetical protein